MTSGGGRPDDRSPGADPTAGAPLPGGSVRQTMEPLIFEKSRPGHRGVALPTVGVPTRPLEELLPGIPLRTTPPRLPELSEPHIVRHYTKLSQLNHCVWPPASAWIS